MQRPTATELMNHQWMIECQQALASYEEAELASSPPLEMPPEETFESATVARQAAIMQEKQIEEIASDSPTLSPTDVPNGSGPGLASVSTPEAA